MVRARWGTFSQRFWILAITLFIIYAGSVTCGVSEIDEDDPDTVQHADDEEIRNTTLLRRNLTGIPQIDYLTDPNLPHELNGYNLSSYPFFNKVPTDINFTCAGLKDGFYASIEHQCQLYHHCIFGTRHDFLCANYTAFDQRTFICQFVSDVDCPNSGLFFSRNDALYKATTEAPVSTSAPNKMRRINQDLYTSPRPKSMTTTTITPSPSSVDSYTNQDQKLSKQKPSYQKTTTSKYDPPPSDTEEEEENYAHQPRLRPRPRCGYGRRRRCRRPRPRPVEYDDDYDDYGDYEVRPRHRPRPRERERERHREILYEYEEEIEKIEPTTTTTTTASPPIQRKRLFGPDSRKLPQTTTATMRTESPILQSNVQDTYLMRQRPIGQTIPLRHAAPPEVRSIDKYHFGPRIPSITKSTLEPFKEIDAGYVEPPIQHGLGGNRESKVGTGIGNIPSPMVPTTADVQYEYEDYDDPHDMVMNPAEMGQSQSHAQGTRFVEHSSVLHGRIPEMIKPLPPPTQFPTISNVQQMYVHNPRYVVKTKATPLPIMQSPSPQPQLYDTTIADASAGEYYGMIMTERSSNSRPPLRFWQRQDQFMRTSAAPQILYRYGT